MKTPAVLIVFLFLAVHSWAAGLIGQKYDVCVEQLGKPTKHVETGSKVVSDLWTFEQGDWSIEVGLWNGLVHIVSYKRIDGKTLTPEQTKALLAGFGENLAWTKDPVGGGYRRSDEKLKAKATQVGLTFLTTELARNL